jgi:hypothetical protein
MLFTCLYKRPSFIFKKGFAAVMGVRKKIEKEMGCNTYHSDREGRSSGDFYWAHPFPIHFSDFVPQITFGKKM